jgi:uncharacterized protein (DUF2267 family)
MNYQEFMGLIGRRARFDSPEEISRSVRATLQTLAECLSGPHLARISSKLPREAGMHLERKGAPEVFSVHEFFERVSDRSGADKSVAVQRAWAVLSALEQQLTLTELSELRKALPKQYDRLFECAV